MKTPDEIKNGLAYCSGNHEKCSGCPYNTNEDYENKCLDGLQGDALGYIIHLESRLAQVERERDAAVKDLGAFKFCALCEEDKNTQEYGSDRCHSCVNKSNWKWRGVVCDNR